METRDIVVLVLAFLVAIGLAVLDLASRFDPETESSLDVVALVTVLYGFYRIGKRPPSV